MRKFFELILGILIFLSATAYIPGKGMDEAQGIIFRIGITALLIISFYLKPIRFITNKWINTLLGVSFVSVLISQNLAQAVAINPFINILLGVMLLYLITNYAKEEMILNALCWVVGVQAIMVILQAFHVDTLIIRTSGSRADMTGLFEYRYALGVYMGVLAPFLLISKRKLWKAFGIISVILAVCSLSYAAIAIMVVSLVIISYKTRLFIPVIVFIMIASFVGGYFAIKVSDECPNSISYKIKSRIDIHKRFIPCIMNKPFGYGLGCFKHVGPMVVNRHNSPYGDVTDAWSDFTERSMELGFIFLVLFGLLCSDVIRRGGIILIGIPLNMAFHSCFNHYNLCILFIVLFALWEIKQYKDI